jgi:hypothetical protein
VAETQPVTVIIGASDLLPGLKERSGANGEVLTFSDTEALRALEAINQRRPYLVALEKLFAASPPGAALINRIKADPSQSSAEIRVLAHDSDFVRVIQKGAGPPPAPPRARPAPPQRPRPSPRRRRAPVAAAAAAPAYTPAATLPSPHRPVRARSDRHTASPRYRDRCEGSIPSTAVRGLVDLSSVGPGV